MNNGTDSDSAVELILALASLYDPFGAHHMLTATFSGRVGLAHASTYHAWGNE